ncbi:MAG: R3H domain-containing nucleic acid-binding protein [Aquisalimonadaceae bacterium]
MTVTRTDDLDLLLQTLPPHLQRVLEAQAADSLLEVVMDFGRLPQARYPGSAVNLTDTPVAREDIDRVVHAVGEFGADNRAGIPGTLHRISAIRNRKGQIIGLTLRVGRAVFGTIEHIRDQVEAGKSVLLLGPPGVGKTTRLREIARVLADDFNKRVVVIDTSNEIAGDGDVPHPAIGNARRMQVAHPEAQHAVMIEAVENHMPEVIVIDEIGTAAEALAARTIAERGVQLIGTAHGNTLENLVLNPTLSDLIGGVQVVTLSDDEARLRGTQKTVSERKASPTFHAVVELLDREQLIVHVAASAAVDKLLRGLPPSGQRRGGTEEPPPRRRAPTREAAEQRRIPLPGERPRQVAIYPYAISRDLVERVIRSLRLDARTVARPEQADAIIALRSRTDDLRLQRILGMNEAPVYEIKKNSTAQIRRVLQGAFHVVNDIDDDELTAAVQEAEQAVRQALETREPQALPPRPPAVRELQHRVVVRLNLSAEGEGTGPHRHLVIHPD